MQSSRIIGIDPGLRKTGWGVIDKAGNHIKFVACGVIKPDPDLELGQRLRILFQDLSQVIDQFTPDHAAVEETFVNMNASSTLKLGMARGVVLLAPSNAGLSVGEYSANKVKKSIVGVGHATKEQVILMIERLLPACKNISSDAADALAVAICHAHHLTSQHAMNRFDQLKQNKICA